MKYLHDPVPNIAWVKHLEFQLYSIKRDFWKLLALTSESSFPLWWKLKCLEKAFLHIVLMNWMQKKLLNWEGKVKNPVKSIKYVFPPVGKCFFLCGSSSFPAFLLKLLIFLLQYFELLQAFFLFLWKGKSPVDFSSLLKFNSSIFPLCWN